MRHKVSEPQAELLDILCEEAAEVIAIASKIKRFGYQNFHPDNPKVSNQQLLETELGHVRNAMNLLAQAGDIEPQKVLDSSMRKYASIKQYMRYPLDEIKTT